MYYASVTTNETVTKRAHFVTVIDGVFSLGHMCVL